mmetsp:Transcript_10131/g.30018  ORF Transcript_10131/g.30018 Transcript_10131/m.30018 type:complete len:243 (-) Transcript_10131:349-1077(-)
MPNRSSLVDAANLALHLFQVLRRHKVRLVEQDPVSKAHLLDGLVHNAIRLLLPEVLHAMLGVDDRQDAVEGHVALHKVVGKESLRDRRWISKACRLDDDAIQRFTLAGCLLVELLQASDEVTPHGAADTAVVHLDDVLLRDAAPGAQQSVVNADLPELILDDGDLLAVIRLEDVVQKGGFARPEEARDDGDRSLGVLRLRCSRAGLLLADRGLHLRERLVTWEEDIRCRKVDQRALCGTKAT